MGFFSRQEYWSGVPFVTVSLVSPALAGNALYHYTTMAAPCLIL